MPLYSEDDVVRAELDHDQFVSDEFQEWLTEIGTKGFSCNDIDDVIADIVFDIGLEKWSLNLYLLINFKGIQADSTADLKVKLTALWDTYIDQRLDKLCFY